MAEQMTRELQLRHTFRIGSRSHVRLLIAGLAVLALLASWVTSQIAARAPVPAPPPGWAPAFRDDFNGAAGPPVDRAHRPYTTATTFSGGPGHLRTHQGPSKDATP